MAVIQALTTSFKQQLLEGVHDFRLSGGDTFKIALYGSSANINSSTTAYTSTGEIVATGYSAGGATLTCVAPTSYGTTGLVTFQTVTWASSSITDAYGALIYNTTPAHTYTNPSVMVLSFGNARSSQSSTFTITWPTADARNAIIRLQ